MRDVKAVPPGNVGVPVPVWADAALKVLELVRSRIISVVAAPECSRCPMCGGENLQRSDVEPFDAGGVEDVSAWPQPDTTPTIDLSELDRALERH